MKDFDVLRFAVEALERDLRDAEKDKGNRRRGRDRAVSSVRRPSYASR